MNKLCDICGKRMATDQHHTLSGTSERKICDKYDFMKLSLCRQCHTDIHEINTATILSKMLGQAMYETHYTREEYLKEFKKNYLP